MSENKESKNGYGVLIVGVATVIILWSLNWILVWWLYSKNDERGQFGDMFGSVNALFSGLAFAFLIYTIWLQREELSLQREELKLQREALQLQAEELKRQADELGKTAKIQAKTFELQQEQLALTEKQIEDEKKRFIEAIKPKFTAKRTKLTSISPDGEDLLLNLTLITKPTAYNVRFCLTNDDLKIVKHHEFVPLIETDFDLTLQLKNSDFSKILDIIDIEISFQDSQKNKYTDQIKIKKNQSEDWKKRFEIIYD